MSLPPAPHEIASDAFDDESFVAIDRELDLAAERPHVDVSEGPKRGPVLLAVSIVAGSLALAGLITLVRGEPDATPSETDPTEAAIAVPLGDAFVRPEPIAPIEPVAPPKVAKATPKAKGKAAASTKPEPLPSSAKPAVAGEGAIPAAVAPATPRGAAADPSSAVPATTELPAAPEPDPVPQPEPASSSGGRGASLPGLDEPDDYADGDDDDDAPSRAGDEPGSRTPMTDRSDDEVELPQARAVEVDVPEATVNT